jgi:hypothetical protein
MPMECDAATATSATPRPSGTPGSRGRRWSCPASQTGCCRAPATSACSARCGARLRTWRSLAPAARVIVTADTLPAAEQLYAEGADYVLIPAALAAGHLYDLLLHGTADTLAAARREQAATLLAPLPPPAASRDGARHP